MGYGLHPSPVLKEIFREKPYQGRSPLSASVIVIGNDANYSPEITHHNFFESIIEYHRDGVAFWKQYGVHHPFLLNTYPFDKRKGGVRYHTNFAKMNFNPDWASHFSFIELLNVPTIGNTGSNKSRFYELLDKDHLDWVESIILEGKKKFVILNQTLSSEIHNIEKRVGCLKELGKYISKEKPPSVYLDNDNVRLFNGYSFSHSISNEYLSKLSKEIREFVSGVNGVSL